MSSAMRALEAFINTSGTIRDRETLYAAFKQAALAFGFDCASYHLLSRNFMEIKDSQFGSFNSFPEDIRHFYNEPINFANNHIVRVTRAQSQPVHFFETAHLAPTTQSATDQQRFLSEVGFTDGIVFPAFSAQGESAIVAVATLRSKIDMSPQELQTLHYIAYALHQEHLRLTEHEKDAPTPLSPREKDVMQWVAAGKSNSVIGEILSISEHTVDTIMRRCYQKLGVSNRIAAVLRAVSYGMISP